MGTHKLIKKLVKDKLWDYIAGIQNSWDLFKEEPGLNFLVCVLLLTLTYEDRWLAALADKELKITMFKSN